MVDSASSGDQTRFLTGIQYPETLTSRSVRELGEGDTWQRKGEVGALESSNRVAAGVCAIAKM